MGHNISILSKHNLDITNIESLAFDIYNKYEFTIEYGYYAVEEYNKLLENGLDETFISLGTIGDILLNKRFLLIDENFQQKQLYEKHGDALFEIMEYWYWFDFKQFNKDKPSNEQIELEKRAIQLKSYTLDYHSEMEENGFMSIYDEIIVNDLHYYSKWWEFCKTIQERNYFDDDDYQNFRKQIMKDTLLFGGNKAYFVNDQCSHLKGVGQGDEMYYSWQELEDYFNSREKLELVSISKTVLDNNYRKEVRKKISENLAFFDDFEDIK